ncbi:hypothetical protein TI04_05280 [Achromatium sp. WMS2]|nr:hypothetical protein TI04_05280 [Achromatium sp. WMS2]
MTRKILIALLASGLFSATVHATGSWCAYPKQTRDGFVNIRKGPGNNYPIVLRVRASDQLSIETCDQANRWCFVDNARNMSRPGWIHSGYIIPQKDNCGWYDE